SEEHTSELQSLTNFVCRLLLEKKTWGRGWRSRTARWPARRRCTGTPCRSCGSPRRWTGMASRSRCASASRPSAPTTWASWSDCYAFPVPLGTGLAASGDSHVDILAGLAQIRLEPARAAGLRAVTEPEEVLRLLPPSHEDAMS